MVKKNAIKTHKGSNLFCEMKFTWNMTPFSREQRKTIFNATHRHILDITKTATAPTLNPFCNYNPSS
jgi:hypothetical protein